MSLGNHKALVDSSDLFGYMRYDYEFENGTKATAVRFGEDEQGQFLFEVLYLRDGSERVHRASILREEDVLLLLKDLEEDGECGAAVRV